MEARFGQFFGTNRHNKYWWHTLCAKGNVIFNVESSRAGELAKVVCRKKDRKTGMEIRAYMSPFGKGLR